MLLELSVKNFAIIEDLSLKFNNDMTVLTGETGAGKSLIIDTISLLLGARADSDMIRYGESFAKVLGVFTHNHRLDDLFNSNSIKILDNITILREIHESGRNVIKINDTNVTLQFLKNVSVYLADIHIQNDLFKLFNPDNYLGFIDPKSDNKFDKLIFNYSKALYNYLDKYKVYDRIVEGNKNLKDKLEFLEYEKKELEGLELYSGIDLELNDKVNK
ncbi:MAG: AAA family ATPase, partial [Acholeplasmatales bacterium]|nr:AAA family ATPase [Acholeplasmatales bacterium]